MLIIKNFIKNHEVLYKLTLVVWGIFCVSRTKLIFRKVKHDSIKGGGPKILIFALRTLPTANLMHFDAIFGHAFKKLGCDVKMLFCDGVLNSCDADTISHNQESQCFVCKKFGNCVKKSLNLDCISYRQYISDSDIKGIEDKVASLEAREILNYEYFGVNVGAHAQSSTIRHFLAGKLDLSDPLQLTVFRKKLFYAILTTRIAEGVYLKEKPTKVFMLHGVYSTWGAFFDYFRTKNVDVVIYANVPVRFGYFLFNYNGKEFELTAKETWNNFREIPLSKDEEFQVDNYLSDRFKGNASDHLLYKNNFGDISEKQSLLDSLSDKKYSRRYVLYPNLLWDACVEGQGSAVFKDIFNWIDTTIDYFKKRTDCQLIIKPHPAELVWEKSTKGIGNYISSKYPDLPENIVVLNPNVPLKAYELVSPNTICLTFNGFIGLELATQGTPVLIAGNSHYKDAGVVYKIRNIEEYLNLLDNPEKIVLFTKNNFKLAKKYVYFFCFKLLIRIPFYEDDRWSMINWKAMSETKKLLDESSNIMKVSKKIIKGEEVIEPL